MSDIILTHGFFLDEDKIEQQIMRPYPPLGILYIASYLKKKGWTPMILDTTFITRAGFESTLKDDACRIIGIYTTHMTRSSVVRQIRAAKSMNYMIILGGPDSANYQNEYLEQGADIIIIGEGEESLNELMHHLMNDKSRDKHGNINGIVYLNDKGELIRTPARSYLDINSIAWPDRESIDINRYMDVWKEHHGYTSINIITSRGCRFGCRWCSHAVFGSSERRRDPEDCANEVKWIIDKYNPTQLWFADDVFTMDSEWIFRFSAKLKLRNIRIPFETISRADRMQDSDLIKELALMGCRRIYIGSESGSNRILRNMRRGVTTEQVFHAVELCRQNNIETAIFIMWGYEGETPDDIELTIKHILKTQPDLFFTTTVHPIKNTPYYSDIRHKIFYPDNWSTANDKKISIKDRIPVAYYKAADNWLRNAVQADKLKDDSPIEAANFNSIAEEFRNQLMNIWNEYAKG